MPISVLKLPFVIQKTGLSRSTIYSLISKKEFPAPIKLSQRSVGWVESEVESWLETKLLSTRGETIDSSWL